MSLCRRLSLILLIVLFSIPTNPLAAKEPNAYFAYRSFWPEHETMKKFADVGVHTFCVFPGSTENSLGEPYSKYPKVWRWPGTYDWNSLRRQFDEIIALDPDAEFICMIDLNTPTWLARSLGMRGDGGFDSFVDLSNCLANPLWKEETLRYLGDFLKETESQYGARIRAYVLACGQTDEWMDYSGERTSRAKNAAFVEWQKARGFAPEPWPRAVLFDAASFDGFLRDPQKERAVLNAQRFEQELVADAIVEFASFARERIAPEREIGVFFGYILELTDWRAVGCGHLDYERVMSSGTVDFFISPGTYSEREIGGGSGSMAPNGTILAHGRRRLHETDHRTTTYNCDLNEFVSIAPVARWKSAAEDVAGLRREFCLALTDRASIWFFDMWGGSFDSAGAMENVAAMKRVWDMCQGRQGESAAEVLLVVDPQSLERVNGRNPRSGEIYHALRNRLNHIGAPYEVCSFNDLAGVDLSRIKLAVLPGTFWLPEERRKLLRDSLLKDGRSVLWLGPAGADDGETLDSARIKETTGVEYGTSSLSLSDRVGFFGLGEGRWRCAAASEYGEASAAVLRRLAEEAGVHIYVSGSEPVYATDRLLCIHAAKGGTRRIELREPATKIVEVFSGREIAPDGNAFEYDFAEPEAALFEIVR